ncbi:hypothetical protein PI124_g3714 [Phytophthora idaei]|nr:hypothetical protein PI126_g1835 [Phytophthora idaei]KAG3251678.1 hypothetical protein PI124_g3714 [Phytophthora idaei]
MRDLHEVITQLLSGNVLDQFNEQYDDSVSGADPSMDTISTAMESLARRYCPPGTREVLHEELRSLRKTRSVSVEEYGAQLNHLLQLESWVLPDDGTALKNSEKCRYFSAGMPRSWQMQVVTQRRWEKVNDLKDRYVDCDRVEQQLEKDHEKRGKNKPARRESHNQKFKVETKIAHGEMKKRHLEAGEGCQYCKSRGNVWNNHKSDECFRNPVSPRYRPRAGKAQEGKKSQDRPGSRTPWGDHTAAAAAMSVMESTDKTRDDPLDNWYPPQDKEEHCAAVGDASIRTPALRVKCDSETSFE